VHSGIDAGVVRGACPDIRIQLPDSIGEAIHPVHRQLNLALIVSGEDIYLLSDAAECSCYPFTGDEHTLLASDVIG
jgi:hypothetical protein